MCNCSAAAARMSEHTSILRQQNTCMSIMHYYNSATQRLLRADGAGSEARGCGYRRIHHSSARHAQQRRVRHPSRRSPAVASWRHRGRRACDRVSRRAVLWTCTAPGAGVATSGRCGAGAPQRRRSRYPLERGARVDVCTVHIRGDVSMHRADAAAVPQPVTGLRWLPVPAGAHAAVGGRAK